MIGAMYSASMDIALTKAGDVTKHTAWVLAAPSPLLRAMYVALSWVTALTIRRFSRGLSESVLNIAEISAIVALQRDDEEMIDPDGQVSRKLLAMRENVRVIHGKAVTLLRDIEHRKPTATLLIGAARQLTAVCGELYDALTNLNWDIGEHDASFATRREGFVADTPDAVQAMLDRILSGA
jgi:hypothetical protein